MRVMVLIKANKDTEAGVMPSEQMLTEMGKYNEELVKAGVMLDGEGLHPSSRGARVRFSGSKTAVIDAPVCSARVRLIVDFPAHAPPMIQTSLLRLHSMARALSSRT